MDNIVEQKQRVGFLDGIRGWAAMVVLFCHMTMMFLSLSTPEYNNVFFRAFNNGPFAILVFFVLSGYALSMSQLNFERRNLALAVVTRYFRLAIPIIVTSLIAYLLLKNGFFFNLEAATTPETSIGWLGTFYLFPPSFLKMLEFSSFDVFFSYNPASTYNSSLWTMPVEIFGSFMIYIFLGIFRTSGRVYWHIAIVLAIALLVVNPAFSCFIFGYLIAELNLRILDNESKIIEAVSTSFFIIIVVLLAVRPRSDGMLGCLMAASLVLSVSYSSSLKNFFSNSISSFLGKISFPLYLIQIPVICSWSSWLFLRLPEWGINGLLASNINLLTTVMITIVCAYLLLPVERFSIRYSKLIGRLILGRESKADPVVILPVRTKTPDRIAVQTTW